MRTRHRLAVFTGIALGAAALWVAPGLASAGEGTNDGVHTTTPIKHLVVIFQENVSFDHYFATYPLAANPSGEPQFTAKPGTPSVNGLNTPLSDPNNPNSVQPFRLDRAQFETADQDHGYTHEQQAFDAGLMDLFVEKVGKGQSPNRTAGGQVMGYFDGNTVTALWNYAQAFAMSDNSFDTNFGPSTPGAINLVSGQTHGATPAEQSTIFGPDTANGTIIGDPQPTGDMCTTHSDHVSMSGTNVGDLLNEKGISWGWFQGGFREASGVDSNGHPTTDTCLIGHKNMAGVFNVDYIPHHEPFQYYASTANPTHLAPSSAEMIGKTDQANHQYDLTDFWTAVDGNNMPAVSFLKAPGYQDGHARYSDPLDEQTFLVNTINRLQHTSDWRDTAIVIAYDDSDGWYDHQMSPIVNQSQDPRYDAISGASCGTKTQNVAGGYQDRCGYGPRQPLIVISPFAKTNFVDHTTTDQTSILRFIEDNWQTGQIGNFSFDVKAGALNNMFSFGDEGTAHKLILDPTTGLKVGADNSD